MAKLIAIASGKGGTGKTTIAINLGLALAKRGKDIIIVDTNLNTPNIGLHLGAPVLEATFHDVLEGKKSMPDATYLHHSGIKIVPANISINNHKASLDDIHTALSAMSHLGSVVIMDTAPGFGKEAAAAIKAADETIVVTTPDLPSVTDALKTIKIAEKLGSTVTGVIINRVAKDKHEMPVQEIENLLEKNVIGTIPDDKAVRKALNMKEPLVYLFPNSRAGKAFKDIASKIG